VADRDKGDNADDDQLKGIEYRFDPDNHPFKNSFSDSASGDEPVNNEFGISIYIIIT